MNWFEDLFGFREESYDQTRNSLEVLGTMLRSRVNQRSYEIGDLATPSLNELRDDAVGLLGPTSWQARGLHDVRRRQEHAPYSRPSRCAVPGGFPVQSAGNGRASSYTRRRGDAIR